MNCVFSIKKSMQALFYLQSKANVTDKLSLLKLVFFADRYSLRNFAFPLTADWYTAMKNGPVCSQIYDLIKRGQYFDFLSLDEQNFVQKYLSSNDNEVHVLDSGSDYLSPSDIESLDFSVITFGSFKSSQLVDITHSYPEWKKFESIIESGESKAERMDYLDFFNNPSKDDLTLKKYFSGKDPFYLPQEDLEAAKSAFVGA